MTDNTVISPARQRLLQQSDAIQVLLTQSTEIKKAEEALRKDAAQALAQSLAIRRQLDSLLSEYLPRERQALLARVQTLDDHIDEALRDQVRGIFKKQRTHTADALRKDYLEVGLKNADMLKNPDVLKRLTDALVTATEALNQEEAGAANSQVQARQRWQAVYDACDGQQPALAAARKKAKGYLPPWWQKYWPLLAGGAILVVLLVLAMFYLAQPREGPVIAGLEPSSVGAESGPMTLIVSGSNFADDAVVEWVDTDNKTTIITPTLGSPDQVTATIDTNLLQQAGTVRITVRNRAANQVSNERLLVIQALTPTPTHTPVTPTDTPVPPTNTPTNTPMPVIGDLPCVLKLTVNGSGEARLPIEQVTVGEAKRGSVAWSFSVLPVVEKDCGQNGQSDVEEITKRDYRLTPADEAGWLVERTSPTLRLKKAGPLKVELVQEWMVKALSENQEAGSLDFGLEYQISTTEWKTVQGSDGKPLQITLKWDQITVATATPPPTATPKPRPTITAGTVTYPTPILEEPADNAQAEGTVKFAWKYPGTVGLGKHEGFEIRIWKDGTNDHLGAAEVVFGAQEKSIKIGDAEAVKNGCSGVYLWTVAVVRLENGNYQRIGGEALPRKLNVTVYCSKATEVPPS